MKRGASRAPARGLLAEWPREWPREWPTWLALAGCYGAWAGAMAGYHVIGLLAFVPLALAVAFHSSLQHEVLHGHPTRNALLNEALVWLPLGLFIPYRRFRDLHLRHHNDARLTDPYDDPESFYVDEGDYARLGPVMRALLTFNGTFAGRMLIGPALSLWGFWRSELGRARAGDRQVRTAWAHHFAGLALVLPLIWWTGVPLWLYALFAAYPGVSLIMMRSYIEHRAHDDPKQRTGVIESGPFFSLLFLNNNLHRVHHATPATPWYRLPTLYRAERARYLAENGGYLIRGYSEVLRRWLLRPREPVVHPLNRHDGAPVRDPGGE
ncbi:MAG TPA: fatty acid desaturase [Thermohalobaculum sp.]|nr:fatty acid desaturase [Thermohalobaculum sp.]